VPNLAGKKATDEKRGDTWWEKREISEQVFQKKGRLKRRDAVATFLQRRGGVGGWGRMKNELLGG